MAEDQHDDFRAENQRLRSCINDLLGVFTLPSRWYRCAPERVLAILLDALMRLLDLEFAYARLHLSERPVDVYRLAPGRRYSRQTPRLKTALAPWLGREQTQTQAVIAHPLDAGEISLLCLPLGSKREAATVIAASRAPDFPSDIDRLVLRVAVNQAALELQRAAASQPVSQSASQSASQRCYDTLAARNIYLREQLDEERRHGDIIGQSTALAGVLGQVDQVAPTSACVLIEGETGTGKELIARAVHVASKREDDAFIKLNCAAIPTGLLEAELFGHEKGAFTGAVAQRAGRFELADRGTLFLDEVGDIPLALQAKLLRVLQEQEFERLGSTRTQRVDVRVVAASNHNLADMVAAGSFRQDLYYRLNVFPVRLPPLRERAVDILELTEHFVRVYARKFDKPVTRITSATLDVLCAYPWPGNIRELENFIERSVILSSGSTLYAPLAELDMPKQKPRPGRRQPASALKEVEREHIVQTLEACNWTVGGKNGAAARLDMKRTTLQYRMRKLGIERPEQG